VFNVVLATLTLCCAESGEVGIKSFASEAAISALVHRAVTEHFARHLNQPFPNTTATASVTAAGDAVDDGLTAATGSGEATSEALIYQRLINDLTQEAIATCHDQSQLISPTQITATVLGQLALLSPDPARPTSLPLPRSLGRVTAGQRSKLDELLLAELVAEESDWTDYRHDELWVKNELTESLFDALIRDTLNMTLAATATRLQHRH